MMKMLAVALVVVAVVVAAEGTYVWVPTEDCSSPVKLCYEGAQEDINEIAQKDPINPCQKDTKVEEGSCVDYGYTKHIGTDPFFKKIEVYIKVSYWDTRSQLRGQVEMLQEVVLQDDSQQPQGNQRDFEGICYRGITPRIKGVHLSPCEEDEDEMLGLCFPKCSHGADGAGPICFDACPADVPEKMGAFCCKDDDKCNSIMETIGDKIADDVSDIIADVGDFERMVEDIKKLVEDTSDIVMASCDA